MFAAERTDIYTDSSINKYGSVFLHNNLSLLFFFFFLLFFPFQMPNTVIKENRYSLRFQQRQVCLSSPSEKGSIL